MADELRDFLQKKVAEYGGLVRMRFGAGVLGRTGTIAGGCIVVCLAAIFELPGLWKLSALALAFITFVIFNIGALRFANANPTAAVLEGADLVSTVLQDARARDMPAVIEGEVVSDPLAPPAAEGTKQISENSKDA